MTSQRQFTKVCKKNRVGFQYFFYYCQIKKGLCVANITVIRNLIIGCARNEIVDIIFVF